MKLTQRYRKEHKHETLEDTIKHNRSLWSSLNQKPAFIWAKNISIFALLVFYLLPFLGTGEWIDAGITRQVGVEAGL